MKTRLLFAIVLTCMCQLRADETNAVSTPYILTPPAPVTPRINGASVFGVRPGSPFLFTIPVTGARPITYSADNLPSGLKLDSQTGQITGAMKTKGEFMVMLRAKNSLGVAEKRFRIVCGDQIALTPPMGWNSWNCFAHAVSAEKVKAAADAMVKSGLINHGWAYINIDDYWQNNRESNDPTLRGEFRDAQGNIMPNSRFPDMKGLADYVHGLGLKIGLYSSPGPWTCGGCTGSFDHERQDANAYAKWEFDYLKYDWCSYQPEMESLRGNPASYPLSAKNSGGKASAGVPELMKPYAIMGAALAAQKRDIVYSLCQYGRGEVWKWGDQVGGNAWRTTGDIIDLWDSTDKNWQRSVSGIGFEQDQAAAFAKPGNWNDPDMLVVGQVGWGKLHPSRLTPDEQYSHISLWCMLSAPLLIGCDMEKLDAFTLNLLSNDEVLALDQDELGKQATCALKAGDIRVYEKALADGGRALGFFNLGGKPVKLDFTEFAKLGLTGMQHIRDLWRQKNLADMDATDGVLPLTIPTHGVLLYKLTPSQPTGGALEQPVNKTTGAAAVAAGSFVVVKPQMTNELLANPSMGWETFRVSSQRDVNLPSWIPSTVDYARWGWGTLEPQPGKIDTDLLDKALQDAHDSGQKLAFRVMCCSPYAGRPYHPPWLKEVGGKELIVDYNDVPSLAIPDMDDPVVVERHLDFIKRLGARYDGHPDIDHLDLGSIGWWGEWHLTRSKKGKLPSMENRLKVVNAYLAAFKKTPLVMLINGKECTTYATQHGTGWRADSLGDLGSFFPNWNHMFNAYPKWIQETKVQDVWKTAPIAFEPPNAMAEFVEKGWPLRWIFNYGLALHASYFNGKSGKLPNDKYFQAELERFLRRLGYRLVLNELTHPAQAKPGARLNLSMKWQNIGSAPCYRPYRVAYRLTNTNGFQKTMIGQITVNHWLPGSIELFTKEFFKQPDDLPPGQVYEVTDTITLPAEMPSGEYSVAVGIVGASSQEPVVRLGITGRNQDGWYPLSKVQVAP